jgi:hypothetical protein
MLSNISEILTPSNDQTSRLAQVDARGQADGLFTQSTRQCPFLSRFFMILIINRYP